MEQIADSEASRLIAKYSDYDLDFINLFKSYPEENKSGYAYFRIQQDDNNSEISAIFCQMCISKNNLQNAIVQLMLNDKRWKDAIERALISFLFYQNAEIEHIEDKLNKLKCHLKKDIAAKP